MVRILAGSLAFIFLASVHVGSGFVGAPSEGERSRAFSQDGNSRVSESGEVGATGISAPEQIPAEAWLRMGGSIEADRYAIRTPKVVAGGPVYEAHNPEHGLWAGFFGEGVRVRSARGGEAGWEWSLQLARFGYEGALEAIDEVAPVAEGNRVEYRRTALTEWYINDPRGLEQGFTVPVAPSRTMTVAGQGGAQATGAAASIETASATDDPDAGRMRSTRLVLELTAAGLETRQDVAGKSILLVAADGAGTLHYRGLIAWDANGTHLPVEMWVAEGGIRIELDDRGAVYPLTIDPFIESAVLRASDAQAGDEFGFSVAVSGDTAIVGAWQEDGGPGDPLIDAGAAYIFERDQGGPDSWGEVKKLVASDGQADDSFGRSVAVSGDTVIVGADGEDGGAGDLLPLAGAAYIFERDQGGADNWGEVAKLIASDAQADDVFGSSVAISADTAIVGAFVEDGGPGDPLSAAGAAYVFERDQGGPDSWGEVKKLIASDAQMDDLFGTSVAISVETAVVGASGEDGGSGDLLVNAGAAYVFGRDQGGAGNWGEVKKLTASDAQLDDEFGYSVAISFDSAIVGARWDGGPGDPLIDAGAAYIFERDLGGADDWGEAKKLVAFDAQSGDWFGSSVAISADTVVVGAHGESNLPNPDAGAAYAFSRDRGGAGNWGQIKKLTASEAQPNDAFGYGVAISAGTAIVGAWNEAGGAGNPLANAGAAYVFDQTAWAAWAFVLDGFGGLHAAGDGVVPISPAPPYFGFDVARDLELSGDGAHVLDGFGATHTAGPGVVPFNPAPPYFGFDIARDLELDVVGAYVLDGWGGVHAIGGAPAMTPATPYFGFDIARDLELGGGGYYVLDGFGVVHEGAGATALSPAPPYFSFEIAHDLELADGGGGYLLDTLGRVHAFAGAPIIWPPTPFFGFDIARDLELEPGSLGHFVLDGFGGLHAGSGALPIVPAPPFFGFDIARDLEMR